MTKIIKIPTSKITQFESKQTPTIQQEKNIIKKDNIGTVVPGDALRNINLSTVPSVIQDAINAMGLSVETSILANALIMQIQRDIENLGDAIVEKSYIDGQVSYLTSLLGQKSDVGDVASIVDSRIAIVTEDFATTAQVNNLNSRVGESESSITTLNQTINTKDAARATQIEEVEARVNQSLSNYTAVLNLTVDENGNVISQKIESLVAENESLNISINELDQAVVDKFDNWSATVAKFIKDSNGNITGFSFADGTGTTSSFKINATNFKISDSTNSYTPFSISGGNILFNGKVAFTNITGTSDLVSTSNIQNAITNNVTTIDGGKIVTNQAFVNNLNAVGGVVADTITGNELNGIVINGARINGSVIKTSYLDLDGELEVLTNYHITVAMYNANPSLYTDAVYISADNEYRIPSMSTVREATTSSTVSYPATFYGVLRPYNNANSGNNLKAVKVRPTFNNQIAFTIINSKTSDTWFGSNFSYGIKNHFRLSISNVTLLEYKVDLLSQGDSDGNNDVTRVTISGALFNTIVIDAMSSYLNNSYSHNYTLNIGIGTISVIASLSCGSIENSGDVGGNSSGPNKLSFTCTLNTGTYDLPFDWTSERIKFEQLMAPGSDVNYSGITTFSLNQSLYINNMI